MEMTKRQHDTAMREAKRKMAELRAANEVVSYIVFHQYCDCFQVVLYMFVCFLFCFVVVLLLFFLVFPNIVVLEPSQQH